MRFQKYRNKISFQIIPIILNLKLPKAKLNTVKK